MINRFVLFFTVLTLIFQPFLASAKTVKTHYTATGKASWYGTFFHGRKTASGNVFNKHTYTAAHRSLPFGSLIKVTNLKNGKKVILVVNDRGPVPRDRIVDVSEKAARDLGFKNQGMTKVKIEYLKEKSRHLAQKAKSKNPIAICNYFVKNSKIFQH